MTMDGIESSVHGSYSAYTRVRCAPIQSNVFVGVALTCWYNSCCCQIACGKRQALEIQNWVHDSHPMQSNARQYEVY